MDNQKYSRVCAFVDLNAVRHNVRMIEQRIDETATMIAVIKANGYGHGAVSIAHALKDDKRIWGFAVATAGEAFTLRRSGINNRILVLGYVFPEDDEEMCRMGVTPTLFQLSAAKQFSAAAVSVGVTLPVQIAVDTGMTRIGYRDPAEAAAECAKIANLPNIRIEGLFTHFAKADEPDLTSAKRQYARYQEFLSALNEAGIQIPFRHCSNSAGIMSMPNCNLDAVRAGIILYGMRPSGAKNMGALDLKPAMRFISHVSYVKSVEAGVPVSYGGTFVTERETVIATVPVGYADGYPRSLSNKGYVLIRGCRAPVCGRVCMDQMMVDVTGIPGVKQGDEVVLIGKSGEEIITMESLGDLSGRFNYELACGISERVPRVYVGI